MTNPDPFKFRDHINAMPDEQRQQWIRAMIKRMIAAWQVKDQKTLAARLGLHANTVSNWSLNKTIPWPSLYSCHKETGKSLDWLVNGPTDAPVRAPLPQHQAKDLAELEHHFQQNVTVLLNAALSMGMINERANQSLLKGVLNELSKALGQSKP